MKFVRIVLDLPLHSCLDCRVPVQMMLWIAQSHVMVSVPSWVCGELWYGGSAVMEDGPGS